MPSEQIVPTRSSFYLPFATTVYICGYTNSVLAQDIILTPETGNRMVMRGQGEGNKPTAPAFLTLTTAPKGPNANGFVMAVDIFSQQGGAWKPSSTIGGGSTLGSAIETYIVGSEDYVDNDFNDAVVQFLWYPPAAPGRADDADLEEIRATTVAAG